MLSIRSTGDPAVRCRPGSSPPVHNHAMTRPDDVGVGREASASGRWAETAVALRSADARSALGPADLELLGRAAYMLGQDDEYIGALERAHQLYIESDALQSAV